MKIPDLVLRTAFALTFIFSSCDDEESEDIKPEPRILSVKTVSGQWELMERYKYDKDFNIVSITWERSTPHITHGVDSFIYDGNHRLERKIVKIDGLTDSETRYTWQDGKIIAASSYINGSKESFNIYEYDNDGKVIMSEFYKKEAGGGGFLRINEYEYTYHNDGNLHQVIGYLFDPATAKLNLLSTQTFTDYLSAPNPVTSVEVLPHLNLQRTLPTKYTWEVEHGKFTYSFEYHLRSDGYPAERVTNHNGDVERTTYTYIE